jgi:hypothetical protein
MVKRLNIAFSDEEHSLMLVNKSKLKTELNLKTLSWENYFLILSGVKKE